ncbi:UDP-glucuronosyltransferase 2B15 [Drosophila mauritiana]|uniref:UDP-glucuronosyltransferase 2B15 n=1 Tax=Drosophila mauritiana TaxID=7226 RepID=A0A6P8LCW2_DROMA|nr:UDP-glucuronosyltransferase 2B15 [Drosophila mauritiana]
MIEYTKIGILIVFLLGTKTQCSDGANILGVFGTHSPSHVIVHMAVMKALADRGHNITVVTQMKPKMAAHENITVIIAPPTEERHKFIKEYMAEVSNEKPSFWETMVKAIVQSSNQLEGQYEFMMHPNFKEIYENPKTKFDLVFLGLMANNYQLGIAAKLKCPVIISWVGIPLPFMDSIVGNVNDPSYVPTLSVALKAGQNTMDFGLRFVNFLKYAVMCVFETVLDYKMNQFYERAFANELEFPDYQEMKRRVSLLFYNYHSPSEGPIRPTVPQSIEIGGIQVKEQADPLPKELAKFLDNADKGAIFFSLGTNVNTNTFRPDTVDILYKVLSKLPQRVIWKWEDLKNKPGNASNIFFGNWLPQDDILAHPNTKLFITHAGKGGVAEAQYHGVPMVALPIFGDQQGNAEIMTKSGFGRWLDIVTMTQNELKETIHEVLENPTYRETIGKFSTLYRDRPLTARQSVIYWTEYVLRHQGALHLQSPLIHTDFVARNNLDVYGVVLLVSILLIVIIRFQFCKILNVASGYSNRREAIANKLKSN